MRIILTATRSLLRHAGFTTAAVATLALGIGSCLAIYTLLDRVVLDPLPYPESERLVQVTNRVPGVATDAEWNMSTAQFVWFSEHSTSFDGVALYRGLGSNVETPEGPLRARGAAVTSGLFPMLGFRAVHGRVITPDDDLPGQPDVVVLSNGFWRQQFGSDAGVIGQSLNIGGTPHEIIGVLDRPSDLPGYPSGANPQFWTAQRIDPEGNFGNNHVFPMVARLAPNTDPSAAEAELARLTTQLPDRFPNAYSQAFFDQYGFNSRVEPLKSSVIGEVSRTVWILFAAVVVVMIIAAANVANLFIVRMEGKRHELSIRSAIGAGRWDLSRLILTESLLLATAGTALALVVGAWGIPALAALAPASIPRLDGLGVTVGSVGFGVLMAVLMGIGIAVYPLVRFVMYPANSVDMTPHRATAGQSRQRLRTLLVVGQVALALTLVVGSSLLLESMRQLNRIDPGFDADGVLTAGLFVTPSRYGNDVELWSAYRQIMDRVRAIPGVEAVGMTSELPVLGNFGCTIQAFENTTIYERVRSAGLTTCAGQEPTTPGYFEALQIPLLEGRTFTDADNDDPGRGAVIVSRAFAERFWPGENAIGQGLAPSGRSNGPFYHVVGVVGDVPARALDGDDAIAVYYPIVHQPAESGWDYWFPGNMSMVVRTALTDPITLAPAVRSAVAEIDPTIPVANIANMDNIVTSSIGRYRFTSIMLGTAAAMALLLAGVGLYGVVSYVVSLRTREIGIRIAVGAVPSTVGRMVVSRTLWLVGAGLALGTVAALLTTRAMRGLLYGIEPWHATSFVLASVVLALCGAIAAWLPARRASRVDPVVALRSDQ